MKSKFLTVCFLFCFAAQADVESIPQNLSNCVIGYAESQIKTSKQAVRISENAFEKCAAQLSELHDSIGPDKSQWAGLDDQQKRLIAKIRDQTTAKIRDQISSQIVTYVTESRKGS